jgi:anthraniloyl-CoA monooxygenase
MEWFEVCGQRYATASNPSSSCIRMLTRSQRISHENLRLRDAAGWKATSAGSPPQAGRHRHAADVHALQAARADAEEPHRRLAHGAVQRGDGVVGTTTWCTWARARWAAPALVMVEMTCPTPEGRITPGCPGLWNDAQRCGLQTHRGLRARPACHSHRPAARASGPKGSTRVGWEGNDEPLPDGNWPLLMAASAVPYGAQNQTPRAMTRADMDRSPRDSSNRHAAPPRPASTGWNCIAPTATCCRASCRR